MSPEDGQKYLSISKTLVGKRDCWELVENKERASHRNKVFNKVARVGKESSNPTSYEKGRAQAWQADVIKETHHKKEKKMKKHFQVSKTGTVGV